MKIFKERFYYFNGFPRIKYYLNDEEKDSIDFLHRWAFRETIKNNSASFSKWLIRDEDTMFSIAETLYKSRYYFWVVLMMNDMIDPLFDWPMNEHDLYEYTKKKYGPENIAGIHHYEADEDDNLYSYPPGTIVSFDYQNHIESGTSRNIIAINNFEYEARKNENKRIIKLLKPEYLDQVKKERDQITKQGFII